MWVTVLDNGSDDQTAVTSAIEDQFPDIEVILSAENLGYSGGCNVGFARALERHADFLLLLNNDVTLAPDAVSELLRVAVANADAAVVSPIISFSDDPAKFWFVRGTLRWGARVAAVHHVDGPIDQRQIESDWVPGTAMLVRLSAIGAVGRMHAPYFLYWEDVDWCMKVRTSGYRILVAPRAHITHKVNASTGALGTGSRYYWERNRLLFTERWAPWPSKLVSWTKVVWRIVVWRLFRRIDTDSGVTLEAYRDYVRRKFGPRTVDLRVEPGRVEP